MTPGILRLDDDALTHQGCVRAANEDSLLCMPREGVWVVADGMGGHRNGKLASERVVASVRNAELPLDFASACNAVAGGIHAANRSIFNEASAAGDQMGSTVVALILRERTFAVLWAGDSRAYLFRDNVLHQLTIDHTQVQQMVERGLLNPEQAAGHPMGHVLARAVGVQQVLQVDAISDEALPGDIFVLCSDGLHGVVRGEEIAANLFEHGPRCAERLVELCLERGAPDNVTVAIVSASEPTTVTFAANVETE
jgi:serine/threonine protein phosphatase PrpC